jgi:UDP-N-acetylglucosamine 2-epimerase (non-hydrolysing)
MKVMTIVGTRPEIIRLACIIKKLDQYVDHILVHTGQNYDYELNKVFFEDLDLRPPDHVLNVKSDTVHGQIGNILTQSGDVMERIRPDAVLVLGDTNSALSVINAKRLKIPIYHMEAGDRAFDENVPEELNRRIVDHTADVNLAYTEHSRRNLLREGIHPSKIFVTGSPIGEVYAYIRDQLSSSRICEQMDLTQGKFITASIHREENVDTRLRLDMMVKSYNALAESYDMPVVVSTHPRTRRSLKAFGLEAMADRRINWHAPFGLIDYLTLQLNSFCVVSDSGTIHEDSSILNFPAVAIRMSTEKAEAIDAGHCVITGLDPESVLASVHVATSIPVDLKISPMPSEYRVMDVSSKIVRIIVGMTKITHQRVWGDFATEVEA